MDVQGFQAAACPGCGRRSLVLTYTGVGEGKDWRHPARWRYESAECVEGCALPDGWAAAPADLAG